MDVLTQPLIAALWRRAAEPARQGCDDRRAGRRLSARNACARAPVPDLERRRQWVADHRQRAGGPVRPRAAGQRRHRPVGTAHVRRRGPRAACGVGQGRDGRRQPALGADFARGPAVAALCHGTPTRAVGRATRPARQLRPAACPDRGRDRRSDRQVRARGAGRARVRLHRRPGPWGPRVPDQFVPVAGHEPAHGRLGRDAREPRALPARDAACRAQGRGPGFSRGAEAEFGRLPQGRLLARGVPAGRRVAERRRRGPARGFGRHVRAAATDRLRRPRPKTRCRSVAARGRAKPISSSTRRRSAAWPACR